MKVTGLDADRLYTFLQTIYMARPRSRQEGDIEMKPSTHAVGGGGMGSASLDARAPRLAIVLCAASAAFAGGSVARAEEPTMPIEPDTARDDAAAANEPSSTEAPSIATATANGTGCTAGTVDAHVTADGELVVSFLSFERDVDFLKMVSVADCQVNVVFRAPKGVQFGVRRATFRGYTYLEEDVALRLDMQYYFSGEPDRAGGKQIDLMGPYEDAYLVEDHRKDADILFSRCGVDRNLQVRITSRLLNNPRPRHHSYVSVDTLRVSTTYKFCNE